MAAAADRLGYELSFSDEEGSRVIRCAHNVYHAGTGKPGRTDNPACSVCCALPAREKPGALTPTDDRRPGAGRNHGYVIVGRKG